MPVSERFVPYHIVYLDLCMFFLHRSAFFSRVRVRIDLVSEVIQYSDYGWDPVILSTIILTERYSVGRYTPGNENLVPGRDRTVPVPVFYSRYRWTGSTVLIPYNCKQVSYISMRETDPAGALFFFIYLISIRKFSYFFIFYFWSRGSSATNGTSGNFF